MAQASEDTGDLRVGRHSLVAEMTRACARPRRVMQHQIDAGLSEARALFHLMLAAVLYCAASVPAALRSAADLGVEDAADAVIAARLFGFVVVFPLLAYGAAAAIGILGRGRGLAVRSALFWSLLLGGPIALGLAAISVAGRQGETAAAWLGPLALAFWAWQAAASLGASLDVPTGRVAATLAACFFILVGGIKLAI
jgi:hypothetical protein